MHCTLLVFIDDATSRLMQLHFVPTESAFAYFEATRAYLEQHGKPVAFYSDKASIFRAVRDSTDFGRGTTQFGRVLFELNHRYIDVFEYPDGRIELRADGANLVYERYDRLPHVDTAAIVENKRLSHALQAALGQAPYSTKALPGTKRSRQFTSQDLDEAVRAVCRAPKKTTVLASS